MSDTDLDYRRIFLGLPVAAIIARNRVMVDCNDVTLSLFRAERGDIVGNLFEVLYPNHTEFEAAGQRMEPLLAARLSRSDDRIMRRIDGTHFWVTVRGHAFNRKVPHEVTAWTFSELSDDAGQQRTAVALTRRERDVAALLIDRMTSKQIAKSLNISPKTVDIHRAGLLRKYAVRNTDDLIRCLLN
ncbi:helix-turn-helix transcriptional regulator [Pseudogemmobacter humi]|nr:helix-turn-helix transcriptional regulator [Pseudogemmobacter humi]